MPTTQTNLIMSKLLKLHEKYYLKLKEISSFIKDTWKVFILATIISFLMILLLVNENGKKSSLSPDTITLLEKSAPFGSSTGSSILAMAPEPSTFASLSASPPISRVFDDSLVASTLSASPPLASKSIIASPPMDSILPAVTITGEPLEKQKLTENIDNDKVQDEKLAKKKCDIFDGRWVYKADASASYCVLRCPFIEEKMSCQSNGRPDFEYEKWVWEARDCDIPMLNGTDMVERFRNKRVVLVGDSLNRNMWESLACILYSSIPYPFLNAEVRFESAHIKTFMRAKGDYNFTLEFYWTPYLVEQNKNHSSGNKVLVLDKLSQNFEGFVGADILIFNTGMHWIQVPPKRGWDIFEYKGKLINYRLHQAYTIAMRTWARWVQKNVDPNKTKVFYRSISTEHVSPQYNQWCYGKTQPLMDESYRSHYPKTLTRVTENVIREMKKPQVKYLNVTKLSQYRIDAHPSVYRSKDWKNLSKLYKDNLSSYTDCGHWCLPGVPDTWNRLFYASLVLDS